MEMNATDKLTQKTRFAGNTKNAKTELSSVYLGGPIQHVNDNGLGWRRWLQKEHPDEFDWVDPMAKYNGQEDEYEEWTDERIIVEDLAMIESSDALLVHWDEVPTCGTPMEIFFSYEFLEMPVVVQTTVPEGDLSPWLTKHASSITETFSEAINELHDYV